MTASPAEAHDGPDLTIADAVWPLASSSDGWHAELALRFGRRGDRTLLKSRRQSGPLTVQRAFYPEGAGVCHSYLLHPPAGIVGGDDLRISVDVREEAHVLLTTPGATRWYFSRGIEAQVQQIASIASGATLEWLPQETLIFDGAHARMVTQINLEGDARFCGWEILGLGRPALKETFEHGRIDFRFEIYRHRRPLLLERQRTGPKGLPGLGGNAACATLIATACDDAALDAVRACTNEVSNATCASTMIGDVLIVRGLAEHCEPLSSAFRIIWERLRPMILSRPASIPRIWYT